jgi:hypothetical protein
MEGRPIGNIGAALSVLLRGPVVSEPSGDRQKRKVNEQFLRPAKKKAAWLPFARARISQVSSVHPNRGMAFTTGAQTKYH